MGAQQQSGLVFTYSVVADPATNGGDYAEIALYSTTQADMPFEVHYSMRRGSPGFYVTAMWTHDSSNGAFGMGECRDNIYAGSIFNWMSVDATRNKLMEVSGGTAIGVPTAPVECSLWTNGVYQGRYEDKYKYSATFGDQRVWGWSSVGTSGEKRRTLERFRQRGILQRWTAETRIDVPPRHHDSEHAQWRPLRHGQRRHLCCR